MRRVFVSIDGELWHGPRDLELVPALAVAQAEHHAICCAVLREVDEQVVILTESAPSSHLRCHGKIFAGDTLLPKGVPLGLHG